MLNLLDRTFGMELEFGDVIKNSVDLPNGYSWSKDERSIVNTNSKKSTPSGDYGGELNTRPLMPTRSDIKELRSVIKDCFNNHGINMWNTGFDGHLFIGDLELEHLKKIFALGYYTTPHIIKAFKLGEWFNVEHLVPIVSREIYQRVMEADTFESLKNTFANSSNIGHYRFHINIMPYFKTKTLEYRIFNGTPNFRETLETIKFMYSFLDYALNNDIEDFRKIETLEDFMNTFDIRGELPSAIPPLIFAESHMEAVRNISKGFAPSRKLISAFIDDSGESVATVNPFHYTTELAVYDKKKLTIYNNSEYNDIVHLLATGSMSISYENQFEVLNQYKDGTAERELILFFIFARIQKYSLNTEYGANEFMSYVGVIPNSIDKLHDTAVNLIKMFENSKYVHGTLNDALENEQDILFQQELDSKSNSVVTQLKNNSDYESSFENLYISYKNIKEKSESVNKLYVVSHNDFLPFYKISKDMSTTLYSSKKSYVGVRKVIDKDMNFSVKVPPDDYEITDKTRIEVREIRPVAFTVLQRNFVKKVTKFKQPKLCYVVMSDGYVLGAFGFDYSKDDNYTLFLLSDFCTNNDVRLLSKLILFIIKTREVKKILERKIVEEVDNCYTKVYTTMPVSMKYRGAFNKVKTDSPKSLQYDFKFGEIESIGHAVREYNKRRK